MSVSCCFFFKSLNFFINVFNSAGFEGCDNNRNVSTLLEEDDVNSLANSGLMTSVESRIVLTGRRRRAFFLSPKPYATKISFSISVAL